MYRPIFYLKFLTFLSFFVKFGKEKSGQFCCNSLSHLPNNIGPFVIFHFFVPGFQNTIVFFSQRLSPALPRDHFKMAETDNINGENLSIMDYLVRQFHYSSVFIFVLDMQNDKHPLGNCLQLKEDEMLQKFSDNFETEKLCGKVRSCHGGSQQYEKVSLYFN